MADGKLVFPIRFDLDSAVRQASGDVDKVIRNLQTQINSRPLKFSVEIDGKKISNMNIVGTFKDSAEAALRAQQMLAKDGSIAAMRKEMSALIIEWEKLSEKERTATDESGKFAGRAGEIVRRFAELTMAANTHARSLSEIMREAEKASTAEEKLAQKTAEHNAKLAASSSSVTNAAYALDFYRKKLNEINQYKDDGSLNQRWANLASYVQQLATNLDNLKRHSDNATQSLTKLAEERHKQDNKQLEVEWRDALKQKAEEEKKILQENARIKKEAEESARRELEITKAANEYKLKQLQKEQEKKRIADEDYQNLVKQIQEENRLAVEKAKNAKLEREKAAAAQAAAEAEARQQAKADRYANLQREIAILQGEEKTIDQVNAKLQIRHQWLNKSAEGNNSFRRNAEEIARLNKVLDDLNAKMQQYMRTSVSAMPERSVSDITAKLQAYQSIMQKADFGSKTFKDAAAGVLDLSVKLQRLQAVQQAELAQLHGEYNAVKSLISALQGYGNTIGQIQAKLSAFQSALNNTTVGGAAFREAAMQIKMMNEELNKANQLYQNYQNKAFEGVGKKNTDAAVRELEKYQQRIREIDAQLNRMNVKGQLTGKNGNATSEANRLLNERIQLESKVQQIATTGADAVKKKLEEEIAAQQKLIDQTSQRVDAYNKKRQQEAEDLAAQQKKAAEEARIKAESQAKAQQENEARKRILNEQRLSYDTLIQKIQMLESARNKTDIGASRWQRLTAEINKAKASLKVITDEMNKAARRSERLARLREIFSMSEKSMAGLSARLQEYNSRLQRLDVGTTAFDRTAQKIAALSAELQRASQYAQDFAQKAFQGLGATDTSKRVQELQYWRNELQRIDEQYNRLRNIQLTSGLNRSQEQAINNLLDQRRSVVENIKQTTLTAEQAALEQERKINAETEKRKKLLDDMRAKEKAHDAAKGERRALAIAEQRRKAAGQLTKEQEKRQRMLIAEENTVNNIQKKLAYYQQKLNGQVLGSKGFEQTARRIEELTRRLEAAQIRIGAATGKTTQEYAKQLGYVDRLIRRMMVYGSVGMIGNFLTKVREVTAQFELQRISLGAILQDQNKANQLFSEIKSFALKSPVSILDLTKYTKQLAAYRIGYDELFETTKKLTDVSVGLGVSMDRVVLAYGQVRATGYLRASEIRQFTEMGVPIVEELAQKLSKLNNEAVTAAQVMDMVSKRGISFQMVKEVFDDMTSAGGIFYNMQEKQGNTLYGLWAKLGDAASVMYSEIGNTGPVNGAMKTLISSMTWLMKNWRLMIGEIGVAIALYLKYWITAKNVAVANRALASSEALAALAAKQRAVQLPKVVAALIGQNLATKASTTLTRLHTAAVLRQAAATNIASKAFWGLNAAIVANPLTAAAVAIAAVGVAMYAAWEKTSRLSRELAKIKEETSVLQTQSVRQFEYLVKEALSAADGSKKQKDALDELNRTYKEMLPEEALKIENLRAMKGNYNELTQAVREYIAAEQESKAINTVNETEEAVQTDMQKLLREVMIDKDLGNMAMSNSEVRRFFIAFRDAAQDTSKTIKEQFIEAFKQAGLQGAEEMWDVVKDQGAHWYDWNPFAKMAGDNADLDYYAKHSAAIGELSRSFAEQEQQINGVREAYAQATADLGIYTQSMQNYNDWVQKNMNSGETILQNQQNVNMQIKGMESMIRQAMQKAGIAWNEEWANIVKSVDPDDLNKVTTLNMEAIVSAIDPNKYPELRRFIESFRKKYNDLVPSDLVAQDCRRKFFEIAQGMKDGGDAMRQYLWDGKVALKDHVKTLGDAVDRIREKVYKYSQYIKNFGVVGKLALQAMGIDVDAMIAQADAIEKYMNYEKTYLPAEEKKNKGGGRKSDTRLQELQEILQCLDKINKKYEELKAKEGDTKALEDTKRIYKSLLDNINKNGKKFGLHFDYPTEFKTLQEYRKAILQVMEDLNKNKKLKGADKAVMNLEEIIGTADADYLQKQIEKQLKGLQEKISRTKVAKDFYDKILAQTGNEELAVRVTYSVYPETGRDLYIDMQDQIRRIFDTGDTKKNLKLKLRLDSVFDDDNERINYRELDKVYSEYQNDIIEKNRDTARKLIAEGQKTAAANIMTWEKELAKAKDFEQQRTEIIDRETQRRAEIYKSNLPQTEKDRLAQLSRDKQSKELADLDVKEFKGSEDFVKMFEDMEVKATDSLKRMRKEIKAVIEADKDMSPENMKVMVEALQKIDEELTGRNPFGDMKEGMKGMFNAIKQLKDARNGLKQAEAEYKLQEPGLNAGIAVAENEKVFADDAKIAAEQQLLSIQQQMAELRTQETVDEGQLILLKQQEVEAQNNLVTAEIASERAAQNLVNAENKKKTAKKKVENEEKKVTDAQDEVKKSQNKFIKGVQKAQKCVEGVRSILSDLEPIFGDLTSDATTLGDLFTAMVNAMSTFTTIMELVIVLQKAFNIETSSNPWMAIAAAVLAVTAALAGFVSAQKVKKANREIERQQELLDQLEYTYERLEKAAEKAFGGDYVNNVAQQRKNLEAQIAAKKRQLAAEQSKGKKTDGNAVNQYKEDIRDLKDQIADLDGMIAEKMLGSDLTSAARDFAQAWLDAYKEFSSTSDAMSAKFKEMIENMIVESLLAKVMERALNPVFKLIDDMDEQDFYSQDFWKKVVVEAEKGADAANYGAGTMMKFLEQAGISVRELGGELTGISRDISSASEESINGLAAGINTQNFYIAQQLTEVRAIRSLIENGGSIPAATPIDYTELQNTALSHLSAIERHTAETVNECRNIAARCEEQTALMRRVISSKGGVQGVNVLIKDWGRQ